MSESPRRQAIDLLHSDPKITTEVHGHLAWVICEPGVPRDALHRGWV